MLQYSSLYCVYKLVTPVFSAYNTATIMNHSKAAISYCISQCLFIISSCSYFLLYFSMLVYFSHLYGEIPSYIKPSIFNLNSLHWTPFNYQDLYYRRISCLALYIQHFEENNFFVFWTKSLQLFVLMFRYLEVLELIITLLLWRDSYEFTSKIFLFNIWFLIDYLHTS